MTAAAMLKRCAVMLMDCALTLESEATLYADDGRLQPHGKDLRRLANRCRATAARATKEALR